MHTRTVGEILKNHRETHRMDLSTLSKLTCIKSEYLQALESDAFDLLPASVFVKGYISEYARVFVFDPEPVIALLRRDFKESTKGVLVPREYAAPVIKKKVFTPLSFVISILAAVFFTLFGYVAFQWYQFTQPPSILILQPADQARVSGEVEVIGSTHPDAVVTVNGSPTALDVDGSFRTTVTFSSEGLGSILVTARDRRGQESQEQRSVFVSF